MILDIIPILTQYSFISVLLQQIRLYFLQIMPRWSTSRPGIILSLDFYFTEWSSMTFYSTVKKGACIFSVYNSQAATGRQVLFRALSCDSGIISLKFKWKLSSLKTIYLYWGLFNSIIIFLIWISLARAEHGLNAS